MVKVTLCYKAILQLSSSACMDEHGQIVRCVAFLEKDSRVAVSSQVFCF